MFGLVCVLEGDQLRITAEMTTGKKQWEDSSIYIKGFACVTGFFCHSKIVNTSGKKHIFLCCAYDSSFSSPQ